MTVPPHSTADLSPDERRALLAQLLREKARASTTALPLSYGQQALFFTCQLAPDSAAYNIAFAASVASPLDVPALRRALQTIVDRHAALRTTFALGEAGPVQLVAGAADLAFAAVDAAGWDDAELYRQVEAAHQRPFDLAAGPLLRVQLFTRAPADHVLLLTVHHIVFDGWSMGVVLDELARLYAAETGGPPANLAPVERQLGDYVAWQRAMLDGPQGAALRGFWHQKLAGNLPVLDLPIDRPRPPYQSFQGGSHRVELRPQLAAELRMLAKAQHTTLSAVLLAAFYALLYRLTRQEDLIIGSPMANRGQAAFQQTVGYLVSPVPLRVAVDGQLPFRTFLAQVGRTLHEALAHESYPFALLVEELQPRRELGRTPIMEVMFTQQKFQLLGQLGDQLVRNDAFAAAGEGLFFKPYPLSQENGQFDLSLVLLDAGENLGYELKYSSDLFDATTIARWAAHLETLLTGIVAALDEAIEALPILTSSEQAQIIDGWNVTARPYDLSRCLHELVEDQATRTPEAVALRFEGQALSFSDLNNRANQLAHHLRSLGVGPDVLVAVCLERSFELVIALLATLKAGGAYVPLDPGYPDERLLFMIDDAAPAVLVTESLLSERLQLATERDELEASAITPALVLLDRDNGLISRYEQSTPLHTVTPDNLAYMIYTSGSTGKPKGALNEHRGIVNRLLWMQEQYRLAPHDRVLQKTPFSFDVSVWEFFWPLLVGATMVIARPEGHKDPFYLAELVQAEGVTTLHFVPSMLQLFLDDDAVPSCTSLKRVICSGEALPLALVERCFARLPHVELHNLYGPTEAAVDVSYWPCRPNEPLGFVPIGFPVANTQLYILDRKLQPVPQGVAGELYIGGVQVGRGYHRRPELTAERFIANPFAVSPEHSDLRTAQLYKTGDLARHLPDGSIVYLGRLDFQVKIRGFRVELGEIETALVRHSAVREAVVVARDDGRVGMRLVAYLVPVDEAMPPQAGALRIHLRSSLPDYMIPTAFITLDRLPLSPNGKLDRKALPAPEPTRARGDDGFVAPSTPTELAVAAVWRELLGLDRVSAYDNFFDLGGHSLIAMEAMARLERQLGLRLNPALIRAQTLGQLAASYDELLRQPMPDEPAAPQASQGLAGRLFGAVRRAIGPGQRQGQEGAQ